MKNHTIRFKTNLKIKYYYLVSFVGLIKGGLKRLFFTSLLISIIIVSILSLENIGCHFLPLNECLLTFLFPFTFELVVFTLTIFLYSTILIYILLPLIKFLYTKFYFKQRYIEYFFNKEEFGWEIAGSKLTYKMDSINYIKIHSDYILISLNLKKRVLVFAADKKTVQDVTSQLKKTQYQKYIKSK